MKFENASVLFCIIASLTILKFYYFIIEYAHWYQFLFIYSFSVLLMIVDKKNIIFLSCQNFLRNFISFLMFILSVLNLPLRCNRFQFQELKLILNLKSYFSLAYFLMRCNYYKIFNIVKYL